MFGKYHDIYLKTSDSLIGSHRIILIKGHCFKNLIEYPNPINIDGELPIINLSASFPDYDEKTIISYVKYLYNRKDIDYNNILNLIDFATFNCDDEFEFNIKKIPNLKNILLNTEIPEHIYLKIIIKIKFNTLCKIFKDFKISFDEPNIDFEILFNNITQYKIKHKSEDIFSGVEKPNLSDELFLLLNGGLDKILNFTELILRHRMNKDDDYLKMFIDSYLECFPHCKDDTGVILYLISKEILVNSECNTIKSLLDKQTSPGVFYVLYNQMCHNSKIYGYIFLNGKSVQIENPLIFELLKFKVYVT